MHSEGNKISAILIAFSILSATQINSANVTTNISRLHKVSQNDDSLYMQEILRAAKAAELQSYLDEDVDPCNDFYEFACARFPKYRPAKPRTASNMLQIMADALTHKISTFLNSAELPADTLLDRKVKHFYTSCLKLKELTQAAYKSKLLTIIAEFGKMPVLSGNRDWDEQHFDWIAMVAKMRRLYARPALLQLDVAPDFRDGNVNCLYIGQPKMLLDSKALYNDKLTARFRHLQMATIAARLQTFLDVPEALAKATAYEIMAFEIVLSQGMWEGKVEPELMNSQTTVEQWHAKYGAVIDVERLINLTVGAVSTECLYERVESYQANLRHVLPQVPQYVVANYLFYMLLHDDFMLSNELAEPAQRKLCEHKVKSYFVSALDNMIYRHYETQRSEADVRLIYEKLKLSLRNKFVGDEFDWMHVKARARAIEKLQATRFEINSHAHDNSTTEFDELQVNATDYLQNVKNYFLLQGRKFVKSVYELPKALDAAASLSLSPGNLVQANKIVIPVATLQPYFLWSEVYPNSVKFGNLGFLLAHELLHSFDDEGRKFDNNGYQNNWWDMDSILAFNERKKCFVEQYGKYRFGDNHIRGDLVLSENIADNGGLKLAYDAYMLWYNQTNLSDEAVRREAFTQLNFTPSQLFFISFAQLWCTDMGDLLKNLQTATDVHAPNKYRIIGSLSNSAEFSKAFECRRGSPMNPVKKCKIY